MVLGCLLSFVPAWLYSGDADDEAYGRLGNKGVGPVRRQTRDERRITTSTVSSAAPQATAGRISRTPQHHSRSTDATAPQAFVHTAVRTPQLYNPPSTPQPRKHPSTPQASFNTTSTRQHHSPANTHQHHTPTSTRQHHSPTTPRTAAPPRTAAAAAAALFVPAAQ